MSSLFISYTQDSPARKAEVKALAEELRSRGLDVILDQDQPASGPRGGWPQWSGRVAEETLHVLSIASQNYHDCWHGRKPPGVRNGATHEALTLLNRVYEGGAGADFLRFAWFDRAEIDHIPLRLKGLTYFDASQPQAIADWVLDGSASVAGITASAASARTVASAIPFDFQTPALPPAFVGRREQLQVAEHLMAKGGGMSLVGDARIGKSSLLGTIAEAARRSMHPVCLVDGQTQRSFDWPEIVRSFTLGEVNPTASQCSSADQAANVIQEWIARQTKRPVLLIDEAEDFIQALEVRFWERLRGMMSQLCLVIATRIELPEAFERHRHTGSPFGNTMTVERLSLLDESSAQAIADRAGANSGLLRYWAGAHPFYLQLLGVQLGLRGDESSALTTFRQTAANRLHEQWPQLKRGEQQGLQKIVNGMALVPELRQCLRERGLLDAHDQPFGQVLHWWMKREALLNGDG